MVESLMSHEAFEENGRCIPFTLDPEHKKKAIALHDQNYTQQVIIRNSSCIEKKWRCPEIDDLSKNDNAPKLPNYRNDPNVT